MEKIIFSFQHQRDSIFIEMQSEILLSGITAIIGKSGSGKTSLLRFLSGLDRATQGEVKFANEVWQSKNYFKKTHLRGCAFVFQDPSLFPHLNVEQNLKFALQSENEKIKFQEVVQVLGLESLLTRDVNTLSGGQKQRIALGRALLSNPKVIFMDEPLSSLDNKSKQEILPYLQKITSNYLLPIVYVSHNLEEIYKIADRLMVIDEGKIINAGGIKEVLSDIEFFSNIKSSDQSAGVILETQVLSYNKKYNIFDVQCEGQIIYVFCGDEIVTQDIHQQGSTRTTKIRVRPQDVSLNREKPNSSSILNLLSTKIVEYKFNQDKTVLIKLQIGGQHIFSQISLQSFEHLNLKVNEIVYAQIKAVSLLS